MQKEAVLQNSVNSSISALQDKEYPSENQTELKKNQREVLKKKLEFYRDKLLQIERRNRSIMLRRIYDKWSFDLSKLIIRGQNQVEKLVERALIKKTATCIIPDADDSDLAEKDRIKLRSLCRNITQLELETGLQETYLGFPFLAGHIEQDSYIRGPFVLFPITIEYRKDGRPPGWYVSFSKDKSAMPNRALLAALKKKARVNLPDSFFDEFEDLVENFEGTISNTKSGSERDLSAQSKDSVDTVFIRELSALLIKNNFPLRSSENKTDNVEVLEPITSEEELVMPKENLHFANYKIIGNFPQGDTAIYADYEELMKKAETGETNQGIIDNLLEIPSEEDLWDEGGNGQKFTDLDLDQIPTRNLNLVIESDASQDGVIVAAQSSECTVVRGPPGTGKSQVIVNLIADALANEKKVLLVCQKRAALDVVYQRLSKVGLSKYAALLHDPINDRQDLYHQLGRLLNPSSTNTMYFGSIDANVDQLSKSIDDLIAKQRSIVSALLKPYFGGITAHRLYTLSKPGYVARLDLSAVAPRMQYGELEQLLEVMGNLEGGCKSFDIQSFPWMRRKSFAEIGLNERNRLADVIDEIIRKTNEKSMLVLGTVQLQQELVDSLKILLSETGMLRRLKPRWTEAGSNAKKLLNDQNAAVGDQNYVGNLLIYTEAGLEFWNSLMKLTHYLDEAGVDEIKADIAPVWQRQNIESRLTRMKESLVNFDVVQAYDSKKAALMPIQREVFEICMSKLINESGWAEILKQEFYIHWIDFIERDNSALRGQPFETYIENRKRLSEAIEAHRNLSVQRIAAKIESRITRPATTRGGNRSYRSETVIWSKLADDLDKKRRVLPVRKLIERYGQIIFNVAPCWLASPEAVSSIFPLERGLFDLIVFDEASQSAVERSLTSLYRGKHVVIMGDEKQLRPFDLFRVRDDEEEEGETVDDTMLSESLLVLAKRIYGYRYLAWHYRSKYQELIDFSNHAFYDGHLQVAPNSLKIPKRPPIRWIECKNGLWADRQNLPEASLVVGEVKKILLQNRNDGSNKSIGIITFNESQQTAILDEIDRRRKEDGEFDELYSEAENPASNRLDDKPFVKNIENVQGDERDIIVFSVGYARDPEGYLHVRFGTLNQEGGENRINVAITRARQEIIIVCSIDPEELKTDSAKNNGPRRLKDYLRYAKFISECKRDGAGDILQTLNDGFGRNVDGDNEGKMLLFESPFEELVHGRLKNLGYTVDTQVGYSGYKIDLAVVHPDDPSRYILAIECDGAAFHSAKSTRERDVMRQQFLESRGWVVERIWSKNWWRNPEREIQRINQRIEELRVSSPMRITKE